MARHTCPGCGRDFSLSGLGQHFTKTREADCIAARTEFYSMPDLDPVSDDEEEDESELARSPPAVFHGDYYGSYMEDELDWPSSDSSVDPADNISEPGLLGPLRQVT